MHFGGFFLHSGDGSDHFDCLLTTGENLAAVFSARRMREMEASEHELRIQALQQKLEWEKTNTLLGQISSHFFYHTLNALQALIVLKPDAAYKMDGDFSRYLRFNNLLAPALASFIYRVSFGAGGLNQIELMKGIAVPGLKDIPFIGELLFNQTPMVYLAFALVIFTNVYFRRTRSGLNYKAIGEHPKAAATLGINVIGIKYVACIICGALAGIGYRCQERCHRFCYRL